GISDSAATAAMIHQPRWNAVTRSASVAGTPTMATNIATPTASAACRIMLMTPEPVANADGGNPPAPTPIRVGNVRRTPMPDGMMPRTTASALGSCPISSAQAASPPTKKNTPAVTTAAAPNRAISRPDSRSDVIGTSSGPGAIASPVCSADHPHAVCSHSATDSSMAPKVAEYGAITSAAPANDLMRNKAGSTNGLGERKQRQTNSASRMVAVAMLPAIPGEPQPQSFILVIAKVSAPTPPVTSAASAGFGRGAAWPGISGSFHQPITIAIIPTGTLTRKIQRQFIVTSRPPMTGPSAAATPPIAVQVRTA